MSRASKRAALVAVSALVVGLSPVVTAQAAAPPAPPYQQCPAIGAAPGCEIMLVVNADGSVSVQGDPSVGPYDGSDDTLVGIVNNSGKPVAAVTVSGPGSDLSGFDADGICSGAYGAWPGSASCPYGPTGYEGPGTSFVTSPSLPDSAEIDFAGGLAPGGSAYFALEGALTSAELTARQGPLGCDPVGGPAGGVPDYCIPQDWDVHTAPGSAIGGVEPLNLIISARSTVPAATILAAMRDWQTVATGTGDTTPKGCLSAETGQVTGSAPVTQDSSWRLDGCIGGNWLSLTGRENHARLWQQPVQGSTVGGATFVAASFETACVITKTGAVVTLVGHLRDLVGGKLWHCIDGSQGSFGSNGYNNGANQFLLDLESAARRHHWSVDFRLDQRAAGTGGLGADSGAGAGLGQVPYSARALVVMVGP